VSDSSSGSPQADVAVDAGRRTWFFDHYDSAADQTLAFLREAGLELAGKAIADIGCGDGIIDLGIVHRGSPAKLTGFDIVPTNDEHLLEEARRFGVAESLPTQLEFVASGETSLPADDGSFDIALSWSAFEHVDDPRGVFREIRRILKPDGVFFLQLWPFYHSERGSHLWDWFPEPFHHLMQDDADIAARMRAGGPHDPGWTEYMLQEFRTLNRVTLDELQAEMVAVGLAVRRVEVMAPLVDVPEALAGVPLSKLTTAGVKLIAAPAGRRWRTDEALRAMQRRRAVPETGGVDAPLRRAHELVRSWPAPRSAPAQLKRRLLRSEHDRQERIGSALIEAVEQLAARSVIVEQDLRTELDALRSELEQLRADRGR
jgi:SAM-dependent methyltransferase